MLDTVRARYQRAAIMSPDQAWWTVNLPFAIVSYWVMSTFTSERDQLVQLVLGGLDQSARRRC